MKIFDYWQIKQLIHCIAYFMISFFCTRSMHFIAYIFLRLCNLMEVYTSMLKHSVIFFVLRINLQISTSQRNMMGSIFRVNLIRPYHVQCTLLRQRNIIFPANMMTSYLPDFDNDHSNFVYKKVVSFIST